MAADILDTLGDFTSKENWDKFFLLRGAGDSFDWYAEWHALRDPLLSQLPPSSSSSSSGGAEVKILVPGCGSSVLSERLYDAGYRLITNVDFSKVVVSEMLRRHVRARPEMKWRVMDMTQLQFADQSFEIVLDKGGLDALMEPELGSKLGSKYLTEVKRVTKSQGKYLCFTLAESHVIELLLSEFRFGWSTSIYPIPNKSSDKPAFQTFMVVAVKEIIGVLKAVTSFLDKFALDYNTDQAHALLNAIEKENNIRNSYSSGADVLYSLEDLQLGAKGNLKDLDPGRRCQLTLGEKGYSNHSYKAVLLDAKEQQDPFLYSCGAFIVPETRAREWLFTSEEGQWLIAESSKAARLIMVFLDAIHSQASMDDIQKDLSPLIKSLAPADVVDGAKIPFMMANDGVKQRNIVHKSTSTITGPMIVEDVIYEESNDGNSSLDPSDVKIFRRLTFERSLGLVQSEALLLREPEERKKENSSSKIRKRGGKRSGSTNVTMDGYRSSMKVDHTCLASTYHIGVISGFSLFAAILEGAAVSGKKVRTYVVGLGAGLLPMFLRRSLSFLDIVVVELDPTVLDVARKYFGFLEDTQLKVHIGDGIQFIHECASDPSLKFLSGENHSSALEACNGLSSQSASNESADCEMKILIIDADSSDLSSGLTCPPADFVEESFLVSVRNFLSKGGLFIINLVSRSPAIREMVISRLKTVFSHVFCLEVEEDVNEVLFASPSEANIEDDNFPEAYAKLQNLLKVPLQTTDEISKIKRL